MAEVLLIDRLDKLARLETPSSPLLSFYLNTQVQGTGRPTHDLFLRKALHDRLKTYPDRSPERESLERDCWQQTSASIRFIEDPTLLETVGGVGARLRFSD